MLSMGEDNRKHICQGSSDGSNVMLINVKTTQKMLKGESPYL